MTFDRKPTKIVRYISLFSIIAYILSLTQTALTYKCYRGVETYSSISLLGMGGLAILGGGPLEWIIWLANPLYFAAIYRFKRFDKTSRILSIAATAIALSFISWKKILISESGSTGTIQYLHLGYWLWILSLAILTVGTFYLFRNLPSPKENGFWEKQ